LEETGPASQNLIQAVALYKKKKKRRRRRKKN